MFIIKCTSIFGVFITTFFIGYLLSKKYTARTLELKQMQIALDILENKIRYTYEPIKDIFLEITKLIDGNSSILFENIAKNLETKNIEESTERAVKEVKTNITKEDIEVLHNLSKLLGKTDKEGQISQIELAKTFLKTQINKAEKEEEKNAKLYKTLGATMGLAFAIILI